MKRPMKLERIFNDCSVGFVVVDGAEEIQFVNDRACHMIGRARADLLGAAIGDVNPLLRDILRSDTPCQKGHHVINKDKNLAVHIAPITTDGRAAGFFISLLDIRELKRITDELQSYQNRISQFDAIFNTTSDGIWLCDGEGTILAINKTSEGFNGIRAEDFIGKNIAFAAEKGIFDRSGTMEAIKARREVTIVQNVTKRKHSLMVTGTPVFDETGEIAMVVVTERDMTQLNVIRDQLAQTLMVTERYKDELAKLSMQDFAEEGIVAESEEMRKTLRVARRLAYLNVSNILILGESGTGKGVLAKLIHKKSVRQEKPFVQINCAALPESLLEAELFGYEKGAFTGAREQGKIGLFELAQGGTLFLDEIGDLPLALQAKLLKYLDDNEIIRLGGIKPKKIDCTIIAATNRDLETLTESRQFREDLYFRLNSFVIRIPPLRERTGDIFELVHFFLNRYNQTYQVDKRITHRALSLLNEYSFPGNVRELQNLFKQAVVMSEDDEVDDFVIHACGRRAKTRNQKESFRKIDMPLADTMRLQERAVLEDAVKHCRSTREMARFLGIGQTSVIRKLKKYNLSLR